MTSHELARKLLEMPDVMVVIPGHEQGVDEINDIQQVKIHKNHYHESWNGDHEVCDWGQDTCEDTHVDAIHLSEGGL